jgi:hypothetical protein
MRQLLPPLVLLFAIGCANYSNRSIISDPPSFPPGQYGLYERKSGQLILTCELKAGETFGFEYTGNRPTGMIISRATTSSPDGSPKQTWRLPISSSEYEWRPISSATAISSRVPSAR